MLLVLLVLFDVAVVAGLVEPIVASVVFSKLPIHKATASTYVSTIRSYKTAFINVASFSFLLLSSEMGSLYNGRSMAVLSSRSTSGNVSINSPKHPIANPNPNCLAWLLKELISTILLLSKVTTVSVM